MFWIRSFKITSVRVSLPAAGSFMKRTTSTEWPSCWKSWEGEEHCDRLSGAFRLARVSHSVKAKTSRRCAVFPLSGLQHRLKITLTLLSESISRCCRALTTPLWLWNQIIWSQHCVFLLPLFCLCTVMCFLFAVSSTGSRCLWRQSTSSSSWRCSSRYTQLNPCPCSTLRYQKCSLLSHAHVLGFMTRHWQVDTKMRALNGLFFHFVTLLWRPWWRYSGNAVVQWLMWLSFIQNFKD